MFYGRHKVLTGNQEKPCLYKYWLVLMLIKYKRHITGNGCTLSFLTS